MKTLIAATFVALMFFAFEMVVPKSSEAGMTCRYDYLGNYVCQGTGSDWGSSSTTRTDYLGNDVTRYKNNSGATGTYNCRYDYLGNYVCN